MRLTPDGATDDPLVVDRDVTTGRLLAALADASRRDVVRRVRVEAAPVWALARSGRSGLAAVRQHVAALEHARLVTTQRRGGRAVVPMQQRRDVGTVGEIAEAGGQIGGFQVEEEPSRPGAGPVPGRRACR